MREKTMLQAILWHLLCFCLLLASVRAQTTTTVIDAAGETIVEIISTDALGDTILSTISTISSTTTPDQGPVGQPGTTAEGPTIFSYTTTDAAGNVDVITATFTPTYQPPNPVTPTLTGTVLSYSDWLSLIGTNTVAATNAGIARWAPSFTAMFFSTSMGAGVLMGMWLAFA